MSTSNREQNLPNKNVDLFDRFIMLCAFCLAYLMLYSTLITITAHPHGFYGLARTETSSLQSLAYTVFMISY